MHVKIWRKAIHLAKRDNIISVWLVDIMDFQTYAAILIFYSM